MFQRGSSIDLFTFFLKAFFFFFSAPVFTVETVQGSIAHLPCNISPPTQEDKALLVIWYKIGVISPIYR